MSGRRPPRWLSPSTLKARADATREQLEAQRSTNRAVDIGFGSVQVLQKSGGPLIAGAIAFRFFLFLVPCVFVLVMGFGLGADAAGADLHDVARRAGIAGIAATAIESGADASALARWMTFLLALVALLAGTRSLLKALVLAHALLWDVPPVRIRHLLRAVVGAIAVFIGAVALLWVVHEMRTVSVITGVIGLALYTLMPTGLWLWCSLALFPRRPGVTWLDVLPGAIVFGLGVEALHLVTVFYVTGAVQSKSAAYGAIGVALTILVWAYLVGLLVTYCASLNVAFWRIQHQDAAPGSPAERPPPLSPRPDDEKASPPAGHSPDGNARAELGRVR